MDAEEVCINRNKIEVTEMELFLWDKNNGNHNKYKEQRITVRKLAEQLSWEEYGEKIG